jgi:hypothetical protein
MRSGKVTALASHPAVRHFAPWVSPEVRRHLAVGREFGWRFQVLGIAPFPSAPVRVGEWLLVPADQDNSPIPARAYERVQALYRAGLRPRGFVLVHEAPPILPAHASNNPQSGRLWSSEFEWVRARLSRLLLGVLAAVAILPVLGALLMALAVGVAALAAGMLLFGGMALVDPILVAVTEDGCWIEIDRWDIH